MDRYAELELSLLRRETRGYPVELRLQLPDSDVDIRPGQEQLYLAPIDAAALALSLGDMRAYGTRLTNNLFADPALGAAFKQARQASQATGAGLRIRLLVGPGATELHPLRWETLLDPDDGSSLFTRADIAFSRYLTSKDWGPVRLRSRGQLRALLVAANPVDITDYNLPPIDVAAELERARLALTSIASDRLPDEPKTQPASLENIAGRLRRNSHDILFLVCHGSLDSSGAATLWLEGSDGKAQPVEGSVFVQRLEGLPQRPRLVVLASCESAAAASGDALAAVGPKLVEAGIPAVLAMLGKISMQTLAEFMPVFFNELWRDGQIDRALAVARAAVSARQDYWMPALFMRLRGGRLWLDGFGRQAGDLQIWQSLCRLISARRCTPILGPGLLEPLAGTPRQLALRWAKEHGYPLRPSDQEELPRVAQYVSTHQESVYLRLAYQDSLRDTLCEQHGAYLDTDLTGRKHWSTGDINSALNQAAAHLWPEPLNNPYSCLARLKLPVYISANPDDLLLEAIRAEGGDPQAHLCPWNAELAGEIEEAYNETPSPERPLVYFLFGRLSQPDSLVITEDEYFDYLIGVSANKDLIPEKVRSALVGSALLFLGFHIDDWPFRVFFRMLMTQTRKEMLRKFSHAAAQIEPEKDRILDAQRARLYLEKYFESEKISLYWGSSEEFLLDLSSQMPMASQDRQS